MVESACSAGDLGLIPGSGRSPGEGNGNPLQYSCLENPMDGGALQAKVHGFTKSRTQLSDFAFCFFYPSLDHKLHVGKKQAVSKAHSRCSVNLLMRCMNE